MSGTNERAGASACALSAGESSTRARDEDPAGICSRHPLVRCVSRTAEWQRPVFFRSVRVLGTGPNACRVRQKRGGGVASCLLTFAAANHSS